MQPYERLEKEFGEWTTRRNIVVCSSGTAALHLALETLQIPLGSEVIVPEFTMIACARAVTLAGLKPVFVDCRDDLLIDPEKILPVITERTKAIMPVHIYGRLCDMKTIGRIADRHGLYVIEDFAEAHGADQVYTGDAVCYSFYRNKIIAGEEGGAIAFLRKDYANRARQLRSMGFTDAHDFTHIPRGHNYRLSNTHAELILGSLRKVDEDIQKRKQIECLYDNALKRIGCSYWAMPKRDVLWVYDVRITGADNLKLVNYLNERGIAARVGFKPMSMQPEYRGLYEHLNAYRLSKEIVYLPVYPHMQAVEVHNNITVLVEAVGN